LFIGAIFIGIQDRKEREKAEMREKILQAAVHIIKTEGIEKLSIRKLADRIEYSPAIIYHYFRDKEEIVDQIIGDRYAQFLNAVLAYRHAAGDPLEQLLAGLRRFILLALEMGAEYSTVMFCASDAVLAHTAVLRRGAANDRRMIAIMRDGLRAVTQGRKEWDDNQLELTCQIIWASMFGLVTRLNIEKVDSEQQERLIDRFLNFVADAI
jgi:AcrR family transcriptional regulator